MHFNILTFIIAIWLLNHTYVASKAIQKRQIYREQVLPHLGGKIPDSAFHTDRLALNQLQKNGIAIPDGVILEQRNPEVYQYTHKAKRPVYKVAATDDRRYTPKEGRYKTAKSLDTTYTIPQVVMQSKELDHINRSSQKQLAIPHPFRKGHHQRTPAIKKYLSSSSSAPAAPPPSFNVHTTAVHQKGETDFLLQYWSHIGDFDWYSNLNNYPFLYENFNQGYFIEPNIFNDFAPFFDTYTHH